jgi:hypothetical protein
MGAPVDMETVARLRQLRAQGISLSGIVAESGLSNVTVIKYTRGFLAGACGCGRPAGHQGWCKVLFERHPAARKNFVMACKRRAKWTDAAQEYTTARYEAGDHLRDIARAVNIMLGRSDITEHAVRVRIGKLGARRLSRRADGTRVNTMRPGAPAKLPPSQVVPFVGLALRGPDPWRELKLRQIAEGSRGRV